MRHFLFLVVLVASTLSHANDWPAQPVDSAHPGSGVYQFEVRKEVLKSDGRTIEVFLPVSNTTEKFPVVVFGHGQAINVTGYEASFIHMAKKGVAVIHPQYDQGFFDQNWRRMAGDFDKLTKFTLNQFQQMDAERIVYAGHSKGAYVAVMAAGVPTAQRTVQAAAVVLFQPAGYDAEYLNNIPAHVPVTVFASDKDTVIKEPAIREIYDRLNVTHKQFIRISTYKNVSPELPADHFLVLSKASPFGGRGVNPFHYHGVWKWLIGAAWDIGSEKKLSESYIYGDEAATSGHTATQHEVIRNWTSGKVEQSLLETFDTQDAADVLVYLNSKTDLSPAYNIKDRAARVSYVYDQLRSHAQKSQGAVVALLKNIGVDHRTNYLSNSIHIEHASFALIEKLTKIPNVRAITKNTRAQLKLPNYQAPRINDPVDPKEIPAHFKTIGVDRAWNELGVKGKGIVIGGQDTGYMWDHPSLAAQYRGNGGLNVSHDYNWHDAIRKKLTDKVVDQQCGYDTQMPCDDSGHGTHTMGTMLGFDGKDNRIGIAPEAKWIGCRNMDNGVGTAASYLECFEYFLAPYPRGGNPMTDGKPELAPHIINNSWGCPAAEGCKGPEFVDAIRALRAAGILNVVSAGNDGPSCNTTSDAPGFYTDEVLSVAALDHRSNEIASFSSRGPSSWNGGLTPNITAPGVNIRSAVPRGGLGDGLYDYKSGTSMAGPHVAGVVALLWSARPDLIGHVEDTIQHIYKTADGKTSSQTCGKFTGGVVPNAVFGYGVINVYKAIQTTK